MNKPLEMTLYAVAELRALHHAVTACVEAKTPPGFAVGEMLGRTHSAIVQAVAALEHPAKLAADVDDIATVVRWMECTPPPMEAACAWGRIKASRCPPPPPSPIFKPVPAGDRMTGGRERTFVFYDVGSGIIRCGAGEGLGENVDPSRCVYSDLTGMDLIRALRGE